MESDHLVSTMQDFKKIQAWHKARALTTSVRSASRGFDGEVAPGLRTQLMIAVMAISTNIAEGAGRHTRLDFAHFLTVAIASANEVEHHLLSAFDVEFIDERTLADLIEKVEEVRKMLFGFRATLLKRDAEERARKKKRGKETED